jgi:hypothetical protein
MNTRGLFIEGAHDTESNHITPVRKSFF